MDGAVKGGIMDYQIERSVEIKAPLQRVWTALTDYCEFGKWFHVDLDQPFEEGHVSTGRMTYPGYEGYPWKAIIEKIQPESLFAFSWSHEDQDVEGSTRVEFHLQPQGNGTLLTVKESGFEALPEDARLRILRSNEKGWKIQTENVRNYLEQRTQ